MNKKIEDLLKKHNHASHDSLIPILQEIQDEFGFLSEEAIVLVGKYLKIPTSKIFGVATFFNQFRFQPKGKFHIQVCQGSSCHMHGADTNIELLKKTLKIKSGQSSRNEDFSLEVVPCQCACAHSPVMSINGKFYSSLTADRIAEIFGEMQDNGE
jgi:NADH-quinone oxidoreductase subunit E